jgi:hypothetical protein
MLCDGGQRHFLAQLEHQASEREAIAFARRGDVARLQLQIAAASALYAMQMQHQEDAVPADGQRADGDGGTTLPRHSRVATGGAASSVALLLQMLIDSAVAIFGAHVIIGADAESMIQKAGGHRGGLRFGGTLQIPPGVHILKR